MTYNQLTQEQYIEKVHKHYPNLEIISEYVNAHSPIKYKCTKCGTIGECKEANSLMRGVSGCGVCGGRKLVKGKNDFATVYPQYVKYFVNKEDAENITRSSCKDVLMKCPICGEQRYNKPTNLVKNQHLACPKCNDGTSYPNRFMYCLLRQLNIEFQREKSFEWSNNRIYDFVVGNTIIEMDGGFHKGSNYKSYEECQKIDQEKDNLAISNGYNIIRIKCYQSIFEKIKEEIVNKLNYLLKLDNIDWVELERQLTDENLVTMACDVFNKYKDKLSIQEMADKLNIRITKLCPLLKTGARLGLTDYDPKKSLSGKYTPNKSQFTSKKVICLNDDKIFESAKKAEEYYNIKKDGVARVCRNERNSIHGLHFEYIK